MARTIASIPFWCLAVLFFIGAVAWVFDDKVTKQERSRRFFVSMLLSGIFAGVATTVMG